MDKLAMMAGEGMQSRKSGLSAPGPAAVGRWGGDLYPASTHSSCTPGPFTSPTLPAHSAPPLHLRWGVPAKQPVRTGSGSADQHTPNFRNFRHPPVAAIPPGEVATHVVRRLISQGAEVPLANSPCRAEGFPHAQVGVPHWLVTSYQQQLGHAGSPAEANVTAVSSCDQWAHRVAPPPGHRRFLSA